MKKRYEVRGMMEWHPVFAVGRARIQVSFTGGHLGEGCTTPASCTTSDPVVQRVIEQSEAFHNHRIRLVACYSEPADDKKPVDDRKTAEDKKPAEIKDPADEMDSSVFETMEFEDYDAASDFLHYKRNIPVDLLLDKESCIAQANKQGIRLVVKDES